MDGISGAETGGLIVKQRPRREHFVVPTDGFHIIPRVGFVRDFLLLMTDERPYLPTVQAHAVSQVHEREQVVVGGNVPSTRAQIRRILTPNTGFGSSQPSAATRR